MDGNMTGRRLFILDGQTPVPVDSQTWCAWMVEADRGLFHTEMHTAARLLRIETVFLGTDQVGLDGGACFFGTTLYRNDEQQGAPRLSRTWDDARAAHDAVTGELKARYRGTGS